MLYRESGVLCNSSVPSEFMKNLNSLTFHNLFFPLTSEISRVSSELDLHIKQCYKLNGSFPVVEQTYNGLLNRLESNE